MIDHLALNMVRLSVHGEFQEMPLEEVIRRAQSDLERADSFREKAKSGDLSFGSAIEALKRGMRVARAEWDGEFVYLVPPASYPVQTGAAKEYFGEGSAVPYAAYFAFKAADGIVDTWQPPVRDCLAEDWQIVK